MPETDLLWMTLVVFLPSAFALGLLFFPRGSEESMRWWSLFGTALTLGFSLFVLVLFKRDTLDFRTDKGSATLLARANEADFGPPGQVHLSNDWLGRYPWIERFHIDYYLGADGISVPLVLLTTMLCFLAMIASWKITKFVRGYCILFLILETGMLGTFLALDFFLFYIFWEVMLLPMYFLIGVWGGPRREYAAIKFFLYTLLGSVFILIALLGFYFTDVRDFASSQLVDQEARRSSLPDVIKARADHDQAYQELRDVRGELDKLKEKVKDQKGDELKQSSDELSALEERYRQANDKVRKAEAAFAKAKEKLAVNSFDLILFQRVGKVAMLYLNDTENKKEYLSSMPALKLAREAVTEAQKSLTVVQKEAKDAEAKWREQANLAPLQLVARVDKLTTEEAIKDAELKLQLARDSVPATEKGVEERLKQWFFTPGFQWLMFLFLFIGFAIKVPVFPFHTWLPDAHVEAPTPISMILAGVLLKLGGYGIIRIAYPICPYAAQYGQLGWYIALFGVINIVYGAFAAMAQTDFKKLVAYSSISHMGYVILGVAAWGATADTAQYWSWGMNGAMFQMIAHGITSAGMFFLVGVIYDRAHHRNLDNFRGLYEPMPLYGGISAVIFFAAMGLPGMCGFVGEFMVVLSAWSYYPFFAVLSALTVVLTAAYILWTIQRVFMGENPVYNNPKKYPDIDLRELACIVPLIVLSVLLGILPGLLLNWMEPSVTGLVDSLASLKK